MSSDKLKALLEQQKLANQELSDHIDAMIQTKTSETVDRLAEHMYRQLGCIPKDVLVRMCYEGLGEVPPNTNNICKGVNKARKKGQQCTHQGWWHGYCLKHRDQHPRYRQLMQVGSTDAPPPPPPRPAPVQNLNFEDEEATPSRAPSE